MDEQVFNFDVIQDESDNNNSRSSPSDDIASKSVSDKSNKEALPEDNSWIVNETVPECPLKKTSLIDDDAKNSTPQKGKDGIVSNHKSHRRLLWFVILVLLLLISAGGIYILKQGNDEKEHLTQVKDVIIPPTEQPNVIARPDDQESLKKQAKSLIDKLDSQHREIQKMALPDEKPFRERHERYEARRSIAKRGYPDGDQKEVCEMAEAAIEDGKWIIEQTPLWIAAKEMRTRLEQLREHDQYEYKRRLPQLWNEAEELRQDGLIAFNKVDYVTVKRKFKEAADKITLAIEEAKRMTIKELLDNSF